VNRFEFCKRAMPKTEFRGLLSSGLFGILGIEKNEDRAEKARER
jgi:hypothetical protein